MSQKEPITKTGLLKLKLELNELIETVKPKIMKELQYARGLGDLSENAEYSAAKEKQIEISKRIEKLHNMILNSRVVDTANIDKDFARFGAKVTLTDCDTGKEVSYTLVGKYESDIQKKLISIDSPLGKSILGKQVDQEFEFRAPGGHKTFLIKEIRYEEV
ncbi:transcription elongation factor GreA [Candidatus Nesciobacter abundans]|uniref:Transcription elongation factor GreA n=1 Tax=Candidatus Nesciobacter abundans TaxID=2601668 RepID=A0A5C0UHL8_9PROT|nr:transcription elongation factor GreA [Candidatus Nesciobacter abundans]QEK39190.1 transcription elongation factor GreA [Candidatus Nesciobacter abundans]